MPKAASWRALPALPGLAIHPAHAAPIEGGIGVNAALLLVLLGVWAIVTGLRNLHELRHKHLVPERQLDTGERDHRDRGLRR